MPQVMVRHLAGAFTREQQNQLMDEILDAFARIGGEGIRPNVNITVEEVADGLWSAGGQKLTLAAIEERRRARASGQG